MNNFDRNTRTLIVSFLVAIFALIPLRFIEVGQQQDFMSKPQVLGETVGISAEKNINEVKLEVPYDVLESCVSKEELKVMEDEALKQVQVEGLSNDQIADILNGLRIAEERACK